MNGFSGQVAALAVTAIVVFAAAGWAISAELDAWRRRRWHA